MDDNDIIEYPHDAEEVVASYNDIVEAKLNDAEMMEMYNTILATAGLLARDLGYDVAMPYAGYPKVVH